MNKELKYIGYAVAAVALLKLIGKQPNISGIGKLPRKLSVGSTRHDPQMYVSTWGEYNSGSGKGKWITLTDFSSYNDFVEYCKKLFPTEKHPEFMIQDTMYMPDWKKDYKWITEEEFDFLTEEYSELDDTEKEAYDIYVQLTGNFADIDGFHDAYKGEFDSGEDYAAYCVDVGYINNDTLLQHIDYAQLWRTLNTEGVYFEDGFIFNIY